MKKLEKAIKSSGGAGDSNKGNSANGVTRTGWRYQNPENKTELERNDKTYKWCNKDCHPQPQWCPRKNCMNKADYKRAMEEKNKAEGGEANKISNDFKVALSAIMSDADYKALESQFFGKAGK